MLHDLNSLHLAGVVVEDVEKELEHSSMQEQLDRELKELDKKLEQKEVNFLRSTEYFNILLD